MARGKAVAIDLAETERGELDAVPAWHHAGLDAPSPDRAAGGRVGLTNTAIAAGLGIEKHTVGKWRNRFAAARLDGLHDEPRPGAPRRIGDDAIAETIRMKLESRPAGATHWSLRSAARATGYAPSTIHRIWQAFGLQPPPAGTLQAVA